MIIPPPQNTCDTKICGPNSTCSTCAANGCNTYTCEKPNGGVCNRMCEDPGAHCICNKGYHREIDDGLCKPLKCTKPIRMREPAPAPAPAR